MTHPALADGPIYLDYNATTPVDPRVSEAMMPHLTTIFGNPSSSHPYGAGPKRALAAARGQVAALIGAHPTQVVFTGSGSEANLLALRGAVLASGHPSPHVITQATEHPAILETCRALQRLHGVRVTVLPVGADGLVEPAALAEALHADTVLTHRHGALFHTDAAQAAGKSHPCGYDEGSHNSWVGGSSRRGRQRPYRGMSGRRPSQARPRTQLTRVGTTRERVHDGGGAS
ncbi:hypothetical protein GCM10009789_11130 [Kribbella sancticallisti]|uniref:Aminotransferase class V domain-containing protein n=1 Tax=Kribbella sancticallisti TaxID=460087 RepID=A0ABP4NFG4_9ACTN